MLKKFKKSLNKFLDTPRSAKTFVAISFDFASCAISVWASYYLRLGEFVSLSQYGIESLIFALFISLPIFYRFGLYKAIFRYSGVYTLLIVSRATLVYSIFYSTIITYIGIAGVPRTIGFLQPLIFLILAPNSFHYPCTNRILHKPF